MRMRRILVGMSQEKLGEQLGLTFQQIQKYERATNRISASRLFDIARILEVPIAYFYEGLDEAGDAASVDTSFDYLADGQASAEGVRLNRAFQRIGDTNVQKRIVELVNALADAPSED